MEDRAPRTDRPALRVFISWSGSLSHDIALVFHDWLKVPFPHVSTFMSSRDVERGGRWVSEISRQLDDSDFGLIFLTRDNLEQSPWMLFEAGALAKRHTQSRVVPVLVDMSVEEFARSGSPLTMFQAMTCTRTDLEKLMVELNQTSEAKRQDEQLRLLAKAVLGPLLTRLDRVKRSSAVAKAPEQRSAEEYLVQILDEMRDQRRLLSTPELVLPIVHLRAALQDMSPRDREVRGLDDRFLIRTELHQRIITVVRDVCVKTMPNGVSYRPPRPRRKKEFARPHPALQKLDAVMVELLTSVARMFSFVVPPDTRVWAALRDLRGDDQYHTFSRGGEFSPERSLGSAPLSTTTSKSLQRLKLGGDHGHDVIITGSGKGPEEWEVQRNDLLGEDRSVIMTSITASSFRKDRETWRPPTHPWILSVNANRREVFTELHFPLMQCVGATLSLLLNVALHATDLEDRNGKKGQAE